MLSTNPGLVFTFVYFLCTDQKREPKQNFYPLGLVKEFGFEQVKTAYDKEMQKVKENVLRLEIPEERKIPTDGKKIIHFDFCRIRILHLNLQNLIMFLNLVDWSCDKQGNFKGNCFL